MRQITRPAIGQHAHNIVVRKGHDQAEQHGDGNDVCHHRQGHIAQALPACRTINRCRFIKLFRHGFECGQIHDHEEGRAIPDIDDDDGKSRPPFLTKPGYCRNSNNLKQPIDG